MYGQNHFIGSRLVVQSLSLIAEPEQLGFSVTLANVCAKLDQFHIYSIVECIRMCGIAGTLDCDRTLVICIRGRTPGTVLFFHIHTHSTIHADTILTGSLSGSRSKNITQSLYRALTDYTMRCDTVDCMGSLPGMIRT